MKFSDITALSWQGNCQFFHPSPGQLIILSVKPWLRFHCELFSSLLKRQAFDWIFYIVSSLTQLSWFCWADLDEFVQIIAPRCSDHLNWDASEKRADQYVKPLEYERLNISPRPPFESATGSAADTELLYVL